MINYYKLIKNNSIVNVATNFDFRRYQNENKILLVSDIAHAQYIQINDKLYRDNLMISTITNEVPFEEIDLIEINEEEYNILSESIESGKEIIIEPEPDSPEPPEEFIDPNDIVTVEYVKNAKISEMNYCCNNEIKQGVDITLSDGNTYHFSLAVQDQLNLIALNLLVSEGETSIPYHADGEACRFYSDEDIKQIIKATTQFKIYHTSYFNSLKMYIDSLNDISTISEVKYGMEVPSDYQSDVLKHLKTIGVDFNG